MIRIKDKSKFGWIDFGLLVLIFFTAASYLYLPLMNDWIDGPAWMQTARFRILMILAGSVLLSVLVFPKDKTVFSAACTALLPMGILDAVANYHEFGRWYTVALILITVISGAHLFRNMAGRERLRRPEQIRRVKLIRAYRSLGFGAKTAAMVLVVVNLALYMRYVSTWSPVSYNRVNKNPETYDAGAFAVTAEEVRIITEEGWAGLTEDEKLTILQKIADQEARELGLSYQIYVILEEMEYAVVGAYDEVRHQIQVNEGRLSEGPELLENICHESYHAYEHFLINLYLDAGKGTEYANLPVFRDAATYIDELANYVNGSDNYEEYLDQLIETNAREYAEKEVARYYACYR